MAYQRWIGPEQEHAPPQIIGAKDILVHLDGTPEDEIRLAHAEGLAACFGARLTGVFTNSLPNIADYASPASVAVYVDLENQCRAEGETVAKRLARRFESLVAPNELRKIDASSGEMRRMVATEARWADLLVASCPRGDADRWNYVVEEVVFQAGRGVFLAPEGVRPRRAIQNIVIGWIDSREAARALAEAMPLLRLATSAQIVSVDESATSEDGEIQLADVAAHLHRHGVIANVEVISEAPLGAADAILQAAHRASADLIVTGAYGHSRLRESILGGVTRDLIEQSDIPLLMAH